MAGYSDFSFTSLWARIGDGADKLLASSGNAPRGIAVDLPEAERVALSSRIMPFMAELEQLRLSTLETVDRRARLLVPLAGGGVFLALLVAGQGLSAALIFGLLAAFVGWVLAMGNRSGVYQAAVKNRFAPVISGHLSGFEHAVEPETDMARLRGWRLFPDLQSAKTSDRLWGQRDGRSVSLTEMVIAYAPGRRRNTLDDSLSVSIVEAASGTVAAALVVLTPKTAPRRLLQTQCKIADLKLLRTGDTDFDAAYDLRIDDPGAMGVMTPGLRSAILALGAVAPADPPYLVFMPGYLAVLFPTRLADRAFHVPPYWIPLDAEALLAQFASDLALKNRLLSAVLALPEPAPSM